MNNIQNTRLFRLQGWLGFRLFSSISGPWWRITLLVFGLLFGFFVGGNLTLHIDAAVGKSTYTAFYSILVCEILVRLRSRVSSSNMPSYWQFLDNFRIGFVYSIILEAFKVGS